MERRELKEDEYDEDIYCLKQGVADNKEMTEQLEDKMVDEDTVNDIVDTARKNVTTDAIDFMTVDDLAAKQDDIEAHNHRLEHEVSNMKDDLEELREQAAAAQATVIRGRRVKVLAIQTRNRNGASRQR